MMNRFTETELQNILTEIEQQLQELKRMGYAPQRGDEEFPPKQQQAIEDSTNEKMPTFWQRFLQAAHKDLCEKDGVLYEQWQRWGNLNNKTVVETFAAILVSLGFSGSQLQVLVVALVVLVLHLGIKTVCAG